ncbi:MAG: cytochrome c peroxidase [Cyanobacteria bacterium J06649_11]
MVIILGSAPLDNGDLDYQLKRILEGCAPNNSLTYFQLPKWYYEIPSDPNNPISEEKIELGKNLFFNTKLHINNVRPDSENTISCASCHSPNHGFKSGLRQAIGGGGIGEGENRIRNRSFAPGEIDMQNIATPTSLNSAYQSTHGWTGQFGGKGANTDLAPSPLVNAIVKEANAKGYQGIASQALAALEVHRLGMNEELASALGLLALYDDAFSDFPREQRYSSLTTALALDAYERSMITNEAPFQDWLSGEHYAMSDQSKRGAILFFGKAGCVNCHTGPALNSMAFHAVGMKDLSQNDHSSILISSSNPPENRGREMVTCNLADRNKFKVPQLYNLQDFNFYGHGSSFESIREVVEYFNYAIPEKEVVTSSYFQWLGLKDYEVNDLVYFLTHGLYDDNLERYLP